MAYILAHGVHDLDRHMAPDPGGRNGILDMASAWLWIVLKYVKYTGSVKNDDECDSALKGALALFGVDKIDDGKKLLGLMAGSTEAHAALARVIRSHFKAPTWDFGL